MLKARASGYVISFRRLGERQMPSETYSSDFPMTYKFISVQSGSGCYDFEQPQSSRLEARSRERCCRFGGLSATSADTTAPRPLLRSRQRSN